MITFPVNKTATYRDRELTKRILNKLYLDPNDCHRAMEFCPFRSFTLCQVVEMLGARGVRFAFMSETESGTLRQGWLKRGADLITGESVDLIEAHPHSLTQALEVLDQILEEK